MASGSHGKRFEKDFLASLRSWGRWAERFRDNTWNPKGGKIQGSTESPPDLISVNDDGHAILMELKAVKGISIPLNRLSDHQRTRLQHFPGSAFVVVMFYLGDRAQKRSAVMIPISVWAGAQRRYGRLSLALADLKRDLPEACHLTWVGRKANIGPWLPADQQEEE